MPNVNVMFSFTICKVMLYYSYCLMSMLMRSSPSQPPNKYMPTGQSFQRFRGVLQLDSAPMQIEHRTTGATLPSGTARSAGRADDGSHLEDAGMSRYAISQDSRIFRRRLWKALEKITMAIDGRWQIQTNNNPKPTSSHLSAIHSCLQETFFI